jgi:transketolase
VRNAFIDELVRQAERRPDVVLVVGDLGYSVVEAFAERFPDRYFNAGVAEQDMMGIAAGLASEGLRPFVYSIANFPVFRCAEQIRNDVAYHRLPVTIVSVGGGLAYGNLGYSHHAVQDYGFLRLLPNMLLAAPGDPVEVRACLRYLLENPRPAYLRLGKAGEPVIHQELPSLAPGRWVQVVPGTVRRTLLTTGATLALARQWLAEPAFAGYALHSLPLWGMACKAQQGEALSSWDEVVTVEDHLADGGFGSWLREAEALGEPTRSRVRCKALDPAVCDVVASQSVLNTLGGLVP